MEAIKKHALAHVKELTARTTELVGEVIAKGMLGVLEECIAMSIRIQELEAALAAQPSPAQGEALSQQTADTPVGDWPKDFREVIKGAEKAAYHQGRAAVIEEVAQICKDELLYPQMESAIDAPLHKVIRDTKALAAKNGKAE